MTLCIGSTSLRLATASVFVLSVAMLTATAETPALVSTMAANEVAARQQGVRYVFTSEERSARTGNHLWKEKVVEVDDGPLRRLLAVDGQPLSPRALSAEHNRIQQLVNNPDAFRRENAAHKDDELHATNLLVLLPKAFLLTNDGEENGCVRYKFKPDPSFQPDTYEERVAHAMVGAVSIQPAAKRLCYMQATIAEPVEFGFGLFGKVAQGGNFRLRRTQVDARNWKSSEIHVDISGRILLLKTLGQKQDTIRTDIHVVPSHLTLEQAFNLLMQGN